LIDKEEYKSLLSIGKKSYKIDIFVRPYKKYLPSIIFVTGKGGPAFFFKCLKMGNGGSLHGKFKKLPFKMAIL